MIGRPEPNWLSRRPAAIRSRASALALIAAALVAMVPAEADEPPSEPERKQFTFSWPFENQDAMRPRGGTSRGPDVKLAKAPSAEWLALQEPRLTAFERDRRAILAMAGPYRASFDFIETVQFTLDAKPQPPYQSWGTEYVYVTADEGDFISLQHILVMFFVDEDGKVSGPEVMKHWRQDWRYEDRDLHVYVGRNGWEHRELNAASVEGMWSQAVFQVDDAPRYEAIGRWEHDRNYSSWTSESTWRPLPRREASVRDDYDVLAAINRHTILPGGWVHEEENLKLAIGGDGAPAGDSAFLARELGLNRYERIEGFDFSAGHEYWDATGPFWSDVRAAWTEVLGSHEHLILADRSGGKTLYERLFAYAEGIRESEHDAESARRFIREALEKYVSTRQ